MKIRICLLVFLPMIATTGCSKKSGEDYPPKPTALEAGFLDPPVSARPRGLWTWLNGNVDTAQISLELREAREKGMGGFDIWDVGMLVDPDSVVPAGPPFMGPESVSAIGHAVREAERLGLELGLTVASSWNAGGPWVRPEHGAMGLFRSAVLVTGPVQVDRVIPFPQLPEKNMNERRQPILHLDTVTGRPTFYREVALLAIPLSPDSLISDPGRIVDLTDQMAPDGRVKWSAPPGKWQITRYVCTGTGQPLVIPSARSNGLILDHFNAEATEAHLKIFTDRLTAELGSLKNRSLKYFYTDSYEVKQAVWTPKLQEEFFNRCGYDLRPFLPVLDGFTVQNKEITGRFLFDFHKTLSELIIRNHYRKGVEISARQGLGFVAEAGGPGPPIHNVPFEDLKALGALTIPRGEFWNKHPQIDLLQIVKGISSAAHIYNQPAVEAESFTSVWVWQEGPEELKPLADRALCEGLNRFVYHTFPHTPQAAGAPGWVYNFGTLIHLNNSWWPLSESFHDYLARCSYLLQQGNFVGDVAYYYGDKAPNFVPHKQMPASLGFGYDYDVINTDAILNRLRVQNGKLVLPHGQSYEVLVLPDEETADPKVLKKLAELVKDGALVTGPKPIRSYSLSDWQEQDEEVRRLTTVLWGDIDGVNVKENTLGKGKVIWGKTVRDILQEKGVIPDFMPSFLATSTSLDFIHRSTPEAEIYFLWNKSDSLLDFDAAFRTTGKIPEQWDPLTGEIAGIPVFQSAGRATLVPVSLPGKGAVFIVFRKAASGLEMDRIEQNGESVFPDISGIRPGTGWRVSGNGDLVLPAGGGRFTFGFARGRQEVVDVPALPPPMPLEGPWTVRFSDGWDLPDPITFPDLTDWTAHPVEAVRYFSGVATYESTFRWDPAKVPDQTAVWLDLGTVKEIAEVILNGKSLGQRWCKPYRYDLSGLVQPGENKLLVKVANLLNNRMVGDHRRPRESRRTHSNITKGPNAWTRPWAEVALKSSGLLGPVRLEPFTLFNPANNNEQQ